MVRAAEPGERGQILLVALVVVVLLTSGLALAGALLGERQRAVLREADSLRLTALADAALAEALAHLAAGASFRGLAPHPFGGGTLASEVTRASGGRFEVLAWAELKGRRRTVRAAGRLGARGPAIERWWVVPGVASEAPGNELHLEELRP